MKRSLIIVTILLQTLFILGQKRIERYVSMFPRNIVFTSQDANGYNVTKNFRVESAILAYEANQLVSFTLKSAGSAQITYPVEKMISENSRVKQFWIDRSGQYFVVLSFPVDISDGMGITFISNVNGSTMFDFLFRRILTEKEKREQEIWEAKEREREKSMQAWRQQEQMKEQERKEQEQIRRVKEIENALFKVNKEKVKSTAESFLNNKLLDEIKFLDVTLSETPKKREIYPVAKVLVHFDSLSTDVVEIDNEIVDSDLIKFFNSASKYCTIDSIDYYKYQNHFFYEEKINIQTKPLEKGVCGVRKRNTHCKYYRNTPQELREWCQKNITGNGFHAIEYINCDGQYTIQTITVNKEFEKIIQGKDPGKAKKIWSSIGGIAVLGGVIGLLAL